ncbi:MAG: uroporphyrinogen-III C-methyltransferase [Luteimonas sp.]
MNQPAAPSPPPRRAPAVLWLVVLLVLCFTGWRGWHWWQARTAATQAELSGNAQHLLAMESRIDALRRDQRTQGQRLQTADATNRVLRDELLGISQRAALLEDSVSRLADPDHTGVQALRLDEVELLLTTAAQRLAWASDLDGARRAYALAAGLLDGINDPAYLNLRQTLAQERAAVDALGVDPRSAAIGRLEAFSDTLDALPRTSRADQRRAMSWWRRAFSRVVDVRPSNRGVIVESADRNTGLTALQIELTLARAALERRDAAGFRAALQRVDAWLTRLWPDSAQQRAHRAALRALQATPLTLRLTTLGSSLQQLRALRGAP